MAENSIEFDTALDLCRDRHRRLVLAVLAEQPRSLTLDDLTKMIFRQNRNTPLPEASEEVLTEVRTSLHHVHIPRLEAEDLIEYDRDRGLIEPTEQVDQLESHISAIVHADPELEVPVEL